LAGVLEAGKSSQRPEPKTLARWDELTQKGHYVGIGELDNHGNARSFFGLKRSIFPYEFAFRTIARMYFWKNL